MANPEKYHTPAGYRIRLKEVLNHKFADWFNNMEIDIKDGETILTGRIADQAALHGLFNRLRDMNLTLLSVEQIEWDPQAK